MVHGGFEVVEGGPGGWGGVGAAESVEPDDYVEVDQAASLVFGDLGEGHREDLAEFTGA